MGLFDMIIGMLATKEMDVFSIGDWVEVTTLGEEGEIVGISGDEYEVEIEGRDGYTDVFKKDELKKIQ